MIAVDRVEVGDVVHFVHLLAIANLLFLRLGDGLRGGHPGSQAGNQCRVVGGNLLEHTEAKTSHGVKAAAFAGSDRAQKFEHLLTGVGHVAPGNMAFVDQQDGCTGIGSGGCRWPGSRSARAVGEGAIRSFTGSRCGCGLAWQLREEADLLLAPGIE